MGFNSVFKGLRRLKVRYIGLCVLGGYKWPSPHGDQAKGDGMTGVWLHTIFFKCQLCPMQIGGCVPPSPLEVKRPQTRTQLFA